MEQTARCTKCDETKVLSEFYFSKGKRKWCKGCYRQWHRTRYATKNGADDSPRACGHCGESFQPKIRANSTFCSPKCKEAERRASGRQRDQHLRRKYGISAEDYDRLLAEQGGGCALCGVRPEDLNSGRYRTYLHVDHCHDTGRVRGLLCPEHNLLLGRFGDSPEMFRRVLEYLEAAASD